MFSDFYPAVPRISHGGFIGCWLIVSLTKCVCVCVYVCVCVSARLDGCIQYTYTYISCLHWDRSVLACETCCCVT